MARENIRRVFLSYASKDLDEVVQFDRELRRRGVPLWRDRVNLPRGRDVDAEIERASRQAVGFVFYLTREAADSEYVRETELKYARLNANSAPSFGIVPVFRDDLDEIVERMVRQGRDPLPSKVTRSPYDLSVRSGYPIAATGPLNVQLQIAADFVLDSLLQTLSDRAGNDQRLRIGLATRGAPLGRFPLDLLVDWSPDYPGLLDDPGEYLKADGQMSPPNAEYCRTELGPAVQSLWKNIKKHWHSLKLQIVPQCHLSMAFAAGFKFGRNTGVDLEIVEPHSEEIWRSPRVPEKPETEAWKTEVIEVDESQSNLAVGINVSVVGEDPPRTMQNQVCTSTPDVGRFLYFEPMEGPGRDRLSNRGELAVHRMACAVMERVQTERGKSRASQTHVFYAGPPGLAILLGQQMPNTGQFQIYEYDNAQRNYSPAFLLGS